MKKAARTARDRMISGKLRGKAAREGADQDRLTVDGVAYAWSRRHGFGVHGKPLEVISLSVSLHPGRTRELILDFTLPTDQASAPPRDERLRRALEDGIRAAREAGWEPESRGRAFRYEVDEDGE